MKKVIVFFLVAFMAVTVSAQARDFSVGRVHDFYSVEFNEVYQKALELNKDRYRDFHKIPINDTLLFPGYDGVGTTYLLAESPKNGKHDCIWYACKKYLGFKKYYDNLKPTLVDSLTWNIQAPISSKEDKVPYIIPNGDKIFLAFLFMLLICALFYYFMLRPGRINAMNSINANPVLPGGLSDDASRAREQINGITTGMQIVKVERGRIFGSEPVKVDMLFSNRIIKVDLISGDDTYKVTEFDGSISYFRQHCGNLIAPVANGKFNLPAGWVFVSYEDEQSTWSAPETIKTEEVKPEIEEELPLEVTVNVVKDSALTGKDIAMILEAAGKMTNVPSFISVGDLTLEFPTKKEE